MRFERTIGFGPALLTAAGVAAAGILSGCASRSERNDQLEQARINVRALEQDPDAQSAAPQQLRDARADLQRATDAFDENRSSEEVTRLAYSADREADTGKALAEQYRAHQRFAKANEEHGRVLTDARAQEAQGANEQAQNAREDAQRAQSELQKEQQELSDLKTRQTERGLELTLPSDLLFNTGSAELKPGATPQINRLADFMRSNPNARVIIEGYTDSTGNAAYNEQLSQQRAQAVAGALETHGVTLDRVRTVGRGENYPVASNDSSAGRQQNRRVDIILSDTTGRFAQGAAEGPAVR
jgi:outer membrane protein OmpA-like peptidoglycan-associated protein